MWGGLFGGVLFCLDILGGIFWYLLVGRKAWKKSACFKLTKQSLEDLRKVENVPEEILKNLELLGNKGFATKNEFLNNIKKQIEKEQTVRYKEQILKHAKNSDAAGMLRAITGGTLAGLIIGLIVEFLLLEDVSETFLLTILVIPMVGALVGLILFSVNDWLKRLED